MRPIDADELKEYAIEGLEKYYPYGGMSEYTAVSIDAIDDMPTLDVDLVRHAKWKKFDKFELFSMGDYEKYVHVRCTECNRIVWDIPYDDSNEEILACYPYCHCGAKMDTVEC